MTLCPTPSPPPFDSGTSTNPNTPQAEEDGYLPQTALEVHISSVDSATSTDSNTPEAGEDHSRATDHRTTRSNFETNASSSSPDSSSVRVTRAPAVVSWPSDCRLEKVFLDLDWIPRGAKAGAFFKISTLVPFGGASTRHDGSVRVFIFVPPERIRQLSFNSQPDVKPMGPNTIVLTFDMIRPPALVLPKVTFPGWKVGDSLRHLYSLARQSSFIVRADCQYGKPSALLMQQLCAAVSERRLSSIKHLAFPMVKTLYQGQGGQVLNGDCLADPGVVMDTYTPSLPPPYEDASPATSLPAIPSQGKKRRRTTSIPRAVADSQMEACAPIPPAQDKRRRRSSSESTGKAPSQVMDLTAVDALLDARLSAHTSEVNELHKAHMSNIVELLSSYTSEVKQMLGAHKAEIVQEITSSEQRIEDNIMDGLADTIDDKLWEKAGEVRDEIMGSITSMRLQATLTFPDHPVY